MKSKGTVIMILTKTSSKKRIFFLYVLTLCLIVAVCAGILFGEQSGNGKVVSAEIFHSPNGVTVQKNVKADAPGIDDDRTGLKLSSSVSGSRITVADEIRGLFELNFRVYSPTAFNADGAFYGENVNNYAITLKTLSFVFTDLSDSSASFRVGIEGTCKQNFATPQAYVEAGGIRGGIYTHPENYSSTVASNPNAVSHDYSSTAMCGNTTGANGSDRYTTLWRTSFSNVGYTGSQTWNNADTKLSAPDSNYIIFDPVSMRIYAKSSQDGAEQLIWDLSQEYNDGKKGVVLKPFASYGVTLEFTEIVSGRNADVIVYSFNGQSLSGTDYVNDSGASVFADFSEQAVLKEKYELPAPMCYDVLGDALTDISVSVAIGAESHAVYNAGGTEITTYSEGCYVIPNAAGEMVVTYTAKDAGGFDGLPLNAKVQVFDTRPKTEFTLYGRLEQGELGVNSVVTIPAAAAINAASKNVPSVYLTVRKNGIAVADLNKITASVAHEYTFGELADYVIEYGTDKFNDVLTFSVTTVDTIPAFNIVEPIPEKSRVGDIISIPSATAIFGGETKSARTRLRFPDGGVYETNAILFEEYGLYTVEYSAEFNQKTYTKVYDVTVADVQATFTGSSFKSVVSYDSSARYDAIKGVRLDSGSSSDVFTYSKIIDLTESTKDDLLIEIFNSALWGWYWNEGVVVTLTDAYDPSNYITVTASNYWFYNVVWVKAAAAGQTPIGFADGEIYPQGTPANYDTHWQLGESREWETYIADYSALGLKLYYDNTEKALYTYHGWKGKEKVVDFAATYQANPWDGFTTGEVYLSLSGFNSVVVTQVYKTDLTTDRSFGGEMSIVVDTQGYSEKNLPNAVVGKAYPIFDAYVVDTWEGRKDVSVAVFRNYGYPSFLETEVIDGKFTPDMPGIYSIVYSSRDAFGNETVKTLRVTAVSQSEVAPVYLTLGDSDPDVFVGEYYVLPNVLNIGGGIGKLTRSVTVQNANGETQPIVGNKFFVTMSGEYTIIYRVSDFIGGGEPNEIAVQLSVAASVKETPILYDTVLPRFVLSGIKLKLPAVNALDFKSDIKGVAPSSTSITAVLDGKSVSINGDNICQPEIAVGQSKDMIVTYRAQSVYGTTEKSYTVTVVNPGTDRGYLWEYFQPISGSFTKSEFSTSGLNYRNLVLTSSDDNAAVQFINPILAQGFEFYASAMYGDTDNIIVTLYDSEDMDISVRFEMIRNVGNSGVNGFSINGGVAVDYTGSFTSEAVGIGFVYSQKTFEVTDNNGRAVGKVTKTENGDPFNGFPSGKVWVKIGYGEVMESFGLRINKIGMQTFSDRSAISRAYPAYYCNGYLQLQFLAGETVTIPAMVAQSAVAPITTSTVSIVRVNANGLDSEFMASVSADSPFDIVLPEYAAYKVTYTVSDSFGLVSEIDYILYAIENVPPTLTVNGNIPDNVKIGTTVTLPEGLAQDNAIDDPTVRIFVITPSREIYVLDESRAFVATQAGQYVIRYYAYDDCFNYTAENYVITVS